MSVGYSWKIEQVETTPGNHPIIRNIHWRYTATDGTCSAYEYGDYLISSERHVHYNPSATIADYAIMLEQGRDMAGMKERLHRRIHDLKHPPLIRYPGPTG